MSENTFTLSEPITFEGKTYSILTLRQLRVKDLAAMDLVKGGITRTIAMYSSMCEIPLPVFEKLTGDDYVKFLEAARPFLGALGEAIAHRAMEMSASG